MDYAKEMVEKAKEKGVKLLLPVDTVCADAFAPDAKQPGGEGRPDPRRLAGPGHRPGDREAVLRRRGGRRHRHLERPHGRL